MILEEIWEFTRFTSLKSSTLYLVYLDPSFRNLNLIEKYSSLNNVNNKISIIPKLFIKKI